MNNYCFIRRTTGDVSSLLGFKFECRLALEFDFFFFENLLDSVWWSSDCYYCCCLWVYRAQSAAVCGSVWCDLTDFKPFVAVTPRVYVFIFLLTIWSPTFNYSFRHFSLRIPPPLLVCLSFVPTPDSFLLFAVHLDCCFWLPLMIRVLAPFSFSSPLPCGLKT